MSLKVAPTMPRGNAPILQPFYYTSSLFVDPMREDISRLLSAFAATYTTDIDKPFQLFKTLWHGEGWDLIHLKVLDARARETFLRTVIRLLIERMEPVEHVLIRIGALFALYTFYMIQPQPSMTIAQPQECITLNTDTYEQLLVLPSALQPPLRSYATYILSQFLSLNVFHLIPRSSLGTQNPRDLPHTSPLLTRDIDHGHRKKTGRPSQLAQNQKANETLSALECFVGQAESYEEERAPLSKQGSTSRSTPLPERPPSSEYVMLKEQLMGSVSHETIQAAGLLTMERMRDAERHVTAKNLHPGNGENLKRLESTANGAKGLLGLVDGV